MWQQNELTRRLKLRYPIWQGPFGSGLSSVTMLAAVSEAGGLGAYGLQHLSPAQIRELGAQAHAATRKPFNLNLWVSNHDEGGQVLDAEAFTAACERFAPYYRALGLQPPTMPERYGWRFEDQVEALLAVRPAVFSFVFGIPSADVLRECRRREIVTAGAATTLEEALALEAAGVDLIVASGMEAGGHRVSFLRSAEESLTGTFALVPQIVDCVKVPVIAAGGVADGRGVAAALMLGAQAAQVGTAFLACAESGTSELHRAQLFSPTARRTALTRAFSGRLARGLRNAFVDDWAARAAEILPYPIQGWFTGSFRKAAAAAGRPDMMSLWAGQAAPLLRHRQVDELFSALVHETEALLAPVARHRSLLSPSHGEST
ncbi:MAG TPA: nitronate monooxygenase [Solimonas sp.]|nr:nitronate monooxygenase [Solimonas sp.]